MNLHPFLPVFHAQSNSTGGIEFDTPLKLGGNHWNDKPSKVDFENFNRLKVEISNMKTLPYFDVSAETTLQTDASKKGLGACIIEQGKVLQKLNRITRI